MPSHLFDVPVVSWPGIFSLRSTAAGLLLVDGGEVSSDLMGIFNWGEDAAPDFPSGQLPVHSWLLAWSVKTDGLTFFGADDQWTRLRIEFFEQLGGGPAVSTRTSMLPLTDSPIPVPAVQASGQVRIHSAAAFFTISNNIGQPVTITWDAWAKAA